VLPDHAGLATVLLYPGATRPSENEKLFSANIDSVGRSTALRRNVFRRFVALERHADILC
jgi:hypothetical protein